MPRFSKEKLRSLLFLAILIVIAPFALELVFVAEVLGSEVAVLFLLLFLKEQWRQIEARLDLLGRKGSALLHIVSAHAVASPRVFYVHAAASVVLLTTTGSLFYVTALWYPLAVFGGSAGFG